MHDYAVLPTTHKPDPLYVMIKLPGVMSKHRWILGLDLELSIWLIDVDLRGIGNELETLQLTNAWAKRQGTKTSLSAN